MRPTALALLAILVVPLAGSAQTDQAAIDKALAAAPERAREATMVIRWNADHSYALLEAAERDGTRVVPEYGSLWLSLRGQDRESASLHNTIAMPGATTESTGFPEDRSQGGAYIMAAGTTTAHLMIPGR